MNPPRSPAHGGRVVACLVLLALAMVGCSGTKTAPSTTAPEGYTVISDAKKGFAMAVPSDWTVVPLSDNPAVFDKDANRLRLANPKLASILNQARVLGQSGGAFMAVTPDGIGNVNLTVDKPKEKTIEQIVAASIGGLKDLEATNVAQEPSALAGKPAIKVTFRLPVVTDAGTVPTDEVQHYLLDGGKAFILTVAAAPPEVAAAIASSLRLH